MLIEPDGEPKKTLRITLPLGMQIPQGTRVIVDQDQPITGRYLVCLPNGCMADFEVDAGFVAKLKKAQSITLQGINLPGQAASYPIPLAEFAKANEGPATDPKKFEEDQKKLQDELQKRGGGRAQPAAEERRQSTGSLPVGQGSYRLGRARVWRVALSSIVSAHGAASRTTEKRKLEQCLFS